MSYENQEEGKLFEALFERRCQLEGYHPERNFLTAKRGWKGKLIVAHSNLDFTVIDPKTGRVGFFDCKSFEGEHFTFSHITDGCRRSHQLERSIRYNEWLVPSGFVIWFRAAKIISFFTGQAIEKKGSGSRFCPQDGSILGGWADFRPEPIFTL